MHVRVRVHGHGHVHAMYLRYCGTQHGARTALERALSRSVAVEMALGGHKGGGHPSSPEATGLFIDGEVYS